LKYALDNRNASESATGLIELATSAEVLAGTDAFRAITPAGLFSFPETTGTGEWSFQIPGTAVIVKIGTRTIGGGSGPTAVTFATAFPTRCRAVFLQGVGTSGTSEGNQLMVKDLTASGFNITHLSGVTFPDHYWLAIGE
jgi:hypothetical protein